MHTAPNDMMHYRSYEKKDNSGKFDTKWRTVEKVLQEGMFAPGQDKPLHFFNANIYYDICMKLGEDTSRRDIMKNPPIIVRFGRFISICNHAHASSVS